MNSDNLEIKLTDVKLTLTIEKTISIDNTYSILDIKEIFNNLFRKHILDKEYKFYISENDVTDLDVNVLRSLEIYKSSEIVVKPNKFDTSKLDRSYKEQGNLNMSGESIFELIKEANR